MGTRTVSEAMDFYLELMWLIAQDVYTFSSRESLKRYKFIITLHVEPG